MKKKRCYTVHAEYTYTIVYTYIHTKFGILALIFMQSGAKQKATPPWISEYWLIYRKVPLHLQLVLK